MMKTAYLSEIMATSAPSPHNYTVSQTRRPKFKYLQLKPENSNTFNIISLYYVNSPFGFDSWYRKDFSHWHHIQAGPGICSKSCTLATKCTKCPFTSITPLRLRMHAAIPPLCYTLQRQLYFCIQSTSYYYIWTQQQLNSFSPE